MDLVEPADQSFSERQGTLSVTSLGCGYDEPPVNLSLFDGVHRRAGRATNESEAATPARQEWVIDMKKSKPVDPSTLPSMSATLLAFAKPLLDQVQDPPTAKSLQSVLNIAVVVWNLPLYEKAKHANAAMFRTGLESALVGMPAEGKATIAAMAKARATVYADDPRLAFAEVVANPSGKAEVRATAFLLDGPPGSRGAV